jgi:hypothetical protein
MSKVLFRYKTQCTNCSTKPIVDWREKEIKRDENGRIVIECLTCHIVGDFVRISPGNPQKRIVWRPMSAR